MAAQLNLNREIWEGWTSQDFIDELIPMFDMVMSGRSYLNPFKTKDEIKNWCKDNQPNYKKAIPEVNAFFIKRANL